MPGSSFIVRVETADRASLDRMLGTARQAILGGRVSVLALDVSPAASTDPAIVEWIERNAAVLRNQLDALVLVAPTWSSAFLLRLVLRGQPPPVPYTVARSLDEGLAWVAKRRAG